MDLFLASDTQFDLLRDAGQASNHAIPRVNTRRTDQHSVPMQPFCSSLSVQESVSYMRNSALQYETGFVGGDFKKVGSENTRGNNLVGKKLSVSVTRSTEAH